MYAHVLMHACMHVNVCVCMHRVCVGICARVGVCVHVCARVEVLCVHVCKCMDSIHICVHVCMSVGLCTCGGTVCAFVYVSVHVCSVHTGMCACVLHVPVCACVHCGGESSEEGIRAKTKRSIVVSRFHPFVD